MYQNCQDDLTLGQQIKLRRYACGMSQTDLARTASVRQATVSSVENDENVEWATVREILRELKLKVRLVPIEE
jgi:transcriptional regulator with XRE-family HTH domain